MWVLLDSRTNSNSNSSSSSSRSNSSRSGSSVGGAGADGVVGGADRERLRPRKPTPALTSTSMTSMPMTLPVLALEPLLSSELARGHTLGLLPEHLCLKLLHCPHWMLIFHMYLGKWRFRIRDRVRLRREMVSRFCCCVIILCQYR